jgi:hypothetical protein
MHDAALHNFVSKRMPQSCCTDHAGLADQYLDLQLMVSAWR